MITQQSLPNNLPPNAEYLIRIPRAVPEGRVLCHNHVRHGARTPIGTKGFRAWTTETPPTGFVQCPCGWAHGLPHFASAGYVEEVKAWPPRLKERTHVVSVYLEPPVFEQMRALAFEERTKMHTLMLEAVDLLLKKRGQPSIKKLMGS
jgi:hypothetical protein